MALFYQTGVVPGFFSSLLRLKTHGLRGRFLAIRYGNEYNDYATTNGNGCEDGTDIKYK